MLKSAKFLYLGVFEYEEHGGDHIFWQKIFYVPLKIGGTPLKNQKFITKSKCKKFLYSGVFEYEEHDGDLIFCQNFFYVPLKIGDTP